MLGIAFKRIGAFIVAASLLGPAFAQQVNLERDVVGKLPLANVATQETNTILGNASGSTLSPSSLVIPSCSDAGHALSWTFNGGFGCNTSPFLSAITLTGDVSGTGSSSISTSIGLGKVTNPMLHGNVFEADHTWTGVNLFEYGLVSRGDAGQGITVISPDYVPGVSGIRMLFDMAPDSDTQWSRISAFRDGDTAYSDLLLQRSGGKVGIAMTDLVNTLDVNGTFGVTGNATAPAIIGGTGTTSTLSLQSTSGVGTTGADIIFKVGNNGATEALRILNSGKVGIGTTAPQNKLSVDGSATGIAYNMILQNTATPAVNNSSRIALSPINIAGSYALSPYIEGVEEVTSNNTMGLALGTYNGSAIGERIRITGGGNVGIGQTAPASTFHVQSSAPTITLTNSVGANQTNSGTIFFSETADFGMKISHVGDAGAGQNYGTMVFVGRSSGTDTTFMTLDKNGLLGIGMTPARTLDVTGTFGATGAATLGSTLAVTTSIDTASYLKSGAAITQLLSAAMNAVTVPASTTQYGWNFGTFSATESTKQFILSKAGTISKLYCATATAQPGAGSMVITVRKNSAATALTTTVAAGAAAGTFSDTSNSFSVVAGDLLTVQFANNDAGSASAQIISCGMLLTI